VSTVLGKISGILQIDTKIVAKHYKTTVGRLQPGMLTPFGRLVDGTVELPGNRRVSRWTPITSLGRLEHRLIIELQKNSRRSNRKLAEILGVSVTTVRRHINDLIEAQTIQLTAIPDAEKLGYQTHVFLQLQIEFSEVRRVVNILVEHPQIQYIASCLRSNQLLVMAMFRSPHDLSEFVTEVLGKIPGIIRAETITHLHYEKRTFGWLHPEGNYEHVVSAAK
jgi:DNA-binding Lrp family transcriptional regulator